MTVFVALLLPVLLLLAVVVMDIGNLYVHKRHLQTQVDAGAFAGATKFVGCSFQFGDPVAANAAIKATALGYTGDQARDPATTNLQLQEPADVRVVLNSARYWTDGDPLTGVGLDDTLDTDDFNEAIWAGLRGDNVPYPEVRHGHDMRGNRKELLRSFTEKK